MRLKQTDIYPKCRFYHRPVLMVMLCTLLAFIVAGGWVARDVLVDKMITLSADAGLRLEEIKVYGRRNTGKDEILEAVSLRRDTPMLRVDLHKIHTTVENLGWVRQARIERHFPSRLDIYIEERSALAIYQTSEGHQIIDENGAVINGVKVENFRHLNVISGKNAATEAYGIITALKSEPELYDKVWALAYLSERRWNAFLSDSIRVQLPEENFLEAWRRLAAMDRKHSLTEREITNIDLRIPGQTIIKSDQSLEQKAGDRI